MGLEQAAEKLKSLLSKSAQPLFFMAEVDKVDKNNFTLDAKLEDNELIILGVRLKPSEGEGKTFVQFPVVGSRILLAKLDRTEYFLLASDEIESVLWQNQGDFLLEINSSGELKFNGGGLGGMVKAQELKTQLDKNNALLAALLAVINGAAVPEAGNGAPSALQTALKIAIANQSLGNFSQLENPKISH